MLFKIRGVHNFWKYWKSRGFVLGIFIYRLIIDDDKNDTRSKGLASAQLLTEFIDNPATRFRPPSATVVSAEPFSHGTGTLWCLQKEMATYRH